jgi:hypothetical protein
MPRTLEEILAHADELAKRFEEYEPTAQDEVEITSFHKLRDAVDANIRSEAAIRDAVEYARQKNVSWRLIGNILGTTGEAARQRYGKARD